MEIHVCLKRLRSNRHATIVCPDTMPSLVVIRSERCGKNRVSSVTAGTILLTICFVSATIPQNALLHMCSFKTKYSVDVNLVKIRRRLRSHCLKSVRSLLVTFFGDDIEYNMAQVLIGQSLPSEQMMLHFLFVPRCLMAPRHINREICLS